MSVQHLPTPDRLRHLRAMGLQPLRLRGVEQEQPPVPVPAPAPATSAASAQTIPKATAGQGGGEAWTSPVQHAAAQASSTHAADVRDTAIEGPRLRLWFADAQADALSGPHHRLLQDVLRSVGAMPEQALVMASDGSTSAPAARLTPAASPSSPLEAASAPSPPRAGERVGVRGQTSSAGDPTTHASSPNNLPILAFGTGAPAGSTRVAALARLRDPLEKRIAWPMLRALRRRLQGGS
ncbi:hypothetical protein [Denitratimonas sp. CY0512]|uniref:hypothetical protein n=1 Tax=Denitratimonas sp. CY0512 TaxID=3131940 RepID=UPI003095A29A